MMNFTFIFCRRHRRQAPLLRTSRTFARAGSESSRRGFFTRLSLEGWRLPMWKHEVEAAIFSRMVTIGDGDRGRRQFVWFPWSKWFLTSVLPARSLLDSSGFSRLVLDWPVHPTIACDVPFGSSLWLRSKEKSFKGIIFGVIEKGSVPRSAGADHCVSKSSGASLRASSKSANDFSAASEVFRGASEYLSI